MATKNKKQPRKRTRPGKTYGDVITVTDVGPGAAVAAGRGAAAGVAPSLNQDVFALWRNNLAAKIDAHPHLSSDEKQDAKDQLETIEQEAAKGKKADPGRLEKLLNTLTAMGPDILEVAIATLAGPLVGIGLVVKKVGEKAKIEVEKK